MGTILLVTREVTGFETASDLAKAEYNDNQLSGLGFSSTSHDEVVVKVDNKPFKIKF